MPSGYSGCLIEVSVSVLSAQYLVEGCLTWNALLTDGETRTTMDPILDEMIRVFLRAYGHIAPRML